MCNKLDRIVSANRNRRFQSLTHLITLEKKTNKGDLSPALSFQLLIPSYLSSIPESAVPRRPQEWQGGGHVGSGHDSGLGQGPGSGKCQNTFLGGGRGILRWLPPQCCPSLAALGRPHSAIGPGVALECCCLYAALSGALRLCPMSPHKRTQCQVPSKEAAMFTETNKKEQLTQKMCICERAACLYFAMHHVLTLYDFLSIQAVVSLVSCQCGLNCLCGNDLNAFPSIEKVQVILEIMIPHQVSLHYSD